MKPRSKRQQARAVLRHQRREARKVEDALLDAKPFSERAGHAVVQQGLVERAFHDSLFSKLLWKDK